MASVSSSFKNKKMYTKSINNKVLMCTISHCLCWALFEILTGWFCSSTDWEKWIMPKGFHWSHCCRNALRLSLDWSQGKLSNLWWTHSPFLSHFPLSNCWLIRDIEGLMCVYETARWEDEENTRMMYCKTNESVSWCGLCGRRDIISSLYLVWAAKKEACFRLFASLI